MRALLISTYDLGRQPFGLASPAAWLRRAGIDVDCVDASRESLEDARIEAADAVAFYLPMHTATRLAAPLLDRVRRVNPRARISAYGLYAPLNEGWLRERGVERIFGPEAEEELVAWVTEDQSRSASLIPHPQSLIPRLTFIQPDRAGLPGLKQYASLRMPDGSRRTIGATEATRGCKHLCRHCPIVPVYSGQFRVVPIDVVMADVRAQVAAGAEHMTFGDPDFLNGPSHARRLVERLHHEFPDVTYDITAKIEHLLTHRDILPMFRDTGCLFVTSAVESVDDRVLGLLRKGHTRDDFFRAVDLCRSVDLALSPTFIPFTPWTTAAGYVDLLRVIGRLDLISQVAPIQLAIRLLITADSPLLELPDIQHNISTYDSGSLTWPWRHADPSIDVLQAQVMAAVQRGAAAAREGVFNEIAALAACDTADLSTASAAGGGRRVPYVSEPWYCCAEPMESV